MNDQAPTTAPVPKTPNPRIPATHQERFSEVATMIE